MFAWRRGSDVAPLPDGRFIAIGGYPEYVAPQTSEIYTPAPAPPPPPPPPPPVATLSYAAVEKPAGGKWRLVLRGQNIAASAQVVVDGVKFRKPMALIEPGNYLEIVQEGKLVDGRSIKRAIPVGRRVVISILNADGLTASIELIR